MLKQAKDEFDLDNMCIAEMTVFLPFILDIQEVIKVLYQGDTLVGD